MPGPGFSFDASWGGVRIDVLDSNISHGREKTYHRLPKRDGATGEDSGREPWVCELQFVFIDRPQQEGEDAPPGDYLERFQAFEALVATDEIRRFVHPYYGAKLCSISGFTQSAGDGQPAIYCSATFTEENSFIATTEAGPGAPALSGVHEVGSRALSAGAALEGSRAGLTDEEKAASAQELAGVRAVVNEWDNDPDITPRRVQLEMASLNNALSRRLEQLEVASNIDRYPIMKEYTLLQYQVRLAAEAFTAQTPRVVTINVTEPLPLRVIAARFYGAAEANRRFGQLLDLNPEIRNPSLLPRGTSLKAYARNVGGV